MDFAAQKVLIPRQHVLSIFSECWQFLERRDLEEVLIPIGRRLALSLMSKGYKSKAVEFLGTIESGIYGGTKDISDHRKRLTLCHYWSFKQASRESHSNHLTPDTRTSKNSHWPLFGQIGYCIRRTKLNGIAIFPYRRNGLCGSANYLK